VCPKVRHLQYKVRCLQYKISEITGICRGCTIPVFTWKYPANAWLFRSNCCFFVSSVPLLVEAGYGCLVLVASNVFVITNLTFTCINKNTAPLWMGNLRYQGAWFLPDIRLCRLLTLLLLLWRFLWRRSTPEKSQQPMLWRLSARQNLPGSSGLPIVAPYFRFLRADTEWTRRSAGCGNSIARQQTYLFATRTVDPSRHKKN